MTMATAIFLIVAMSLSIPLLKIWTGHLRRKQTVRGADQDRVGALEAELDELRERVQTLERIVTDERRHLDGEFERLERT